MADGEEVDRGSDPNDPEDDLDDGLPQETGLTSGDPKGGGGCGCATDTSGGAGTLALGLLALATIFRRRARTAP